MATTKYIVNNISGQTITGDFTIDGNLTVTQSTVSNGVGIYRALFTQTGSQVSTDLNGYNGKLIIGETYNITNYQGSDDFSNIANVISGDINQTGCQFIATGTTPNIWSSGTELTSGGGLIVDVLENTLGYDIDWQWAPYGGYGYYLGFKYFPISFTGYIPNLFPRNVVQIKAIPTQPLNWGFFPYLTIYSNCTGFDVGSDDFMQLRVLDLDLGDQTDNALYYTPVEINIKQDLDTTPISVYGSNISAFPYGNVSVRLFAGDNNVSTFYHYYYVEANDINELVTILNSDIGTNYLGTYSVNVGVEDGIILTMATNLKNQFSPNNTLTFEVFSE